MRKCEKFWRDNVIRRTRQTKDGAQDNRPAYKSVAMFGGILHYSQSSLVEIRASF